MKKKRLVKKSIALVLAMFALLSAFSLTSFADTVRVSNNVVNLKGNHEVITTSTFKIDGYMTYAAANDLNFSAMTVAGKTNSYTRSVVVGVTSTAGYSRTMSITTKKTTGTTLNDFCYSGSGDSALYDSTSSGKEITKACVYYFGEVKVTAKAVSASRTYEAHPDITNVQV